MTPDAELLERYLRDDSQAAFAEFVQRNAPLAYTVALRGSSGDVARAQDVCQGAFILAAQQAGKLAHHRAVPAWLHQTCSAATAQLRRSDERRALRDGRSGHPFEKSAQAAPPSNLLLDDALQLIPEEERATLLLRHFAGRSDADIALQLGTTQLEVRRRMERGTERLGTTFTRLGVSNPQGAVAAALAGIRPEAVPTALQMRLAPFSVTAAAGSNVAVSGGHMFESLRVWKAACLITALIATGATIVAVHETSLAKFRQKQVTESRQHAAQVTAELSKVRLQLVRELAKAGESERETSLLLAAIDDEEQAAAAVAAETFSESDVSKRFQQALTLAKAGQHEAALEEYLWCYDTGMPRFSSLSDVRSSVLLSALADLSKSYPPARHAMAERRDAAEKTVLSESEDSGAAAEFAAINRSLGEPQRTLALFDRLPASDPRRRSLGPDVRDQLLKKARYADAARAYPYPMMQLQFSALTQLEGNVGAELAPEMKAEVFKQGRSQAVQEAGKNIEILVGSGDLQHARNFARQVLALDDTPETRALLEHHAQRAGLTQLFP